MADGNRPGPDSDLRRRAAWLLGMLAVVAVLFVVVLSTVIGSGGKTKHVVDSGPLDNSITSPAPPSGSSGSRSDASTPPATGSSNTTPSSGQHAASCPTPARCALDDDIGNAVAAINAYRAAHGKPSVPGTVSDAAKACALNNGNGCSGGWAESQVPGPNGTTAVTKIVKFGKLLDPQLKSIGVGWAYDPGTKQYFFAIVRTD